MTTWQDLERELDAWADAGRRAPFWWRDDDAVEPCAKLDRLLALSQRHDAPVTLAVVPARSAQALGRLLDGFPLATPVQHGFAHRNHAAPGDKKTELGGHRRLDVAAEELLRGRARMTSLFGARFLPLLVPPWNRIDGNILEMLPSLGMSAVSTYGPRAVFDPVPGLRQVNTHADIMRWTEPRGFVGESQSLALLCGHLRARREAEPEAAALDPTEPTGILSHHLAHDEPAWDFLARLLDLLAAHGTASIKGVGEMLDSAGA